MINHFLDLEADGLFHPWEDKVATRIDCTCVLTEDRKRGIEWNAEVGKDWRPEPGDFVIFQNGFDYDLEMLAKFWGWTFDILPDRLNGIPVQFVDTRLLSQLLHADRPMPEGFAQQWKPSYPGQRLPGPHSLATWAYRLGMVKPQLVYGDKIGNVPHEISVEQCKEDCEITRAMYYELMREAKRYSLDLKKSLKCEQAVRHIVTQGVKEGVTFDVKLAKELLPDLDAKMAEIEQRVEPQLPPRPLPKSKVKLPPKKLFKQDGTPTALAEKYFGEALKPYKEEKEDERIHWGIEVGEDLVPLKGWPSDKPFNNDTEPMELGNLQDIKQYLMDEHGWKPTLWNTNDKKERTSPKFQQQGKLCEDLVRLSNITQLVEDIVLWLSYRNRRSVLSGQNGETGWLNHPRLKIDGKLPSDADTMGTNTFRFTHRIVTNVPNKKATYGEQMRSLFTAPAGMVCVGWDASQLEDRCKAHYCAKMPGGEDYIEKILDPEFDAHEENAKAWDMPRAATKNGHYAMQYGCRPEKLASTLGIDKERAEKYYYDWWLRNEPLGYLTQEVEALWKDYNEEFLPAIDGRLVPTRKQHALVNALFQSAGVIAMKYAMVYWWHEIRKRGIPAVQVIHYHDEALCICPAKYADEVGELGVWSIEKAGQAMNFRIPLRSEYKVGINWYEVH